MKLCNRCQQNERTKWNTYCALCNSKRSKALRAKKRAAKQQHNDYMPGSIWGEYVQAANDDIEIDIEVVEPVAAPAPEAPLTTPERLHIARLKRSLADSQSYARDLEKQVLTGDVMREMIGSLGAPNVEANPEWLRGANRQRSTHGTGVLFISDNHLDEVVNPREIGGCNEYNREIARFRMQNTFRNAISLLKGYMAAPMYDGIVCALGGDLVSGNIHDELVETNAAPMNSTMIFAEEVLTEGIGELADEFGSVHVPCVTGNHGRHHKKPRAKQRAIHNYEWSVYQRLVRNFRNDGRVTFDIPEGPDAMFNVYKRRFCLTHGDQFSGGGGIGGIMVPIMRGLSKKSQRQVAIGDSFDVAMMGHWHQYIHTNALIINGSSKGYDEYASANNFTFEPPQQALWIEHPEVGATFRMPVLCDKAA